MTLAEIVIVGAGPTGLALAAELTRLGRTPFVLDQLPAGQNTSRAAVVHARTLEVLQPLGVVPELLAAGVKVATFRVRDHNKVLTTIDFSDLETEFPYTLMCPQDVTERILLRRLKNLGGSVMRPCLVTGIREVAGALEVAYSVDTESKAIQTRWLIGCDGAHSIVRNHTGIAFSGSTYDESFILADVEMDWPLGRDEVSLFLSERGLVVVAPLPGNHFRIVATVDQASEHPSLDDFQAILHDRGPTSGAVQVKRLVWSSRFRVGHRVAERFMLGHVLLAGDAAHVHSPAGGQGMNTGIQDAVSLAQALSTTLDDGDLARLDHWAHDRRNVAKSVVSFTDRMTKFATVSSPAVKAVRNMLLEVMGGLPYAQHALARKLAELDN